MCQPETEGALARALYKALEDIQTPALRPFLDQYDLDIKPAGTLTLSVRPTT